MAHPTLEDYIMTLTHLYERFGKSEANPKRGHPFDYDHVTMTVFFLIMHARRCFRFKAQYRWLENHPEAAEVIGFNKIPSRWTLSRRYKKLASVLEAFIRFIGSWAEELDEAFRDDILFEDKSLFKAQGPVWHREDQKKGRIPDGLRNLDMGATWSKSGYRGWVYGYGLHTTVTQAGFPKLACADTASVSESKVIKQKFSSLKALRVNTLVADDGYTNLQRVRHFAKAGICLLTPAFRAESSKEAKAYRSFIQQPENQVLLKERKTAIEPVFDLLSHLLDTTNNQKQLPVKGLANVQPFLLLGVFMLQLAMIVNSIWGLPLRNVFHILAVFG